MHEACLRHPGAVPAAASHDAAPRVVRLPGVPLAVAALACLAALAGCVKEPQPRATVLRELDSGYTSSNGGGQAYLRNQVNVGLTTRVQ